MTLQPEAAPPAGGGTTARTAGKTVSKTAGTPRSRLSPGSQATAGGKALPGGVLPGRRLPGRRLPGRLVLAGMMLALAPLPASPPALAAPAATDPASPAAETTSPDQAPAAATDAATEAAPLPATVSTPLPALGIDPAQVTVSGLSSGAAMASQLQVAHSAHIRGAALFAAPPWGCARGSDGTATLSETMRHCVNIGGAPWNPANSLQGPPALQPLLAAARTLAARNAIDPLEGLADDRLYLFSGQADTVVPPAVMEVTRAWYAALVPADHLNSNFSINAGHGMIASEGEVPCSSSASPFVNGCAIDGAGIALQTLYPDSLKPNSGEQGKLYSFDQRPLIPANTLHYTGLHPVGHLFVPSGCENGGCRLHISFHGCQQSQDETGDVWWTRAGYNGWAAANRMVVLYPQAQASRRGMLSPFGLPNPRGCWDWWGYTGQDYLSRDGLQIRTLWNMIRRLEEKPQFPLPQSDN